MKHVITIFFLLFLSYLFTSCNKEDKLYRQNLKAIAIKNDSSQYNYEMLFDIVSEIDSTSNVILSQLSSHADLKKLMNNELDAYKNLIETNCFTDSISKLFKNRLLFNESSLSETKLEIKSSRNLYVSCVADYINSIETKPSFIEPIMIRYLTRDGEQTFTHLEIEFPTSNGETVQAYVLSDSLQYYSLPGGGLGLRVLDTEKDDTIMIKMRWWDKKIADTVVKTIISIH